MSLSLENVSVGFILFGSVLFGTVCIQKFAYWICVICHMALWLMEMSIFELCLTEE